MEMEIEETSTLNPPISQGLLNGEKGPGEVAGPRIRTSLRLKYEAEIEVLKKQFGELEDVRIRLGLSQRKICQLLLVDPSAWSRWTRDGQSAPPHIYRALQWYLLLEDKHPTLDAGFWVGRVGRANDTRRLEGELREIQEKNRQLETAVSQLRDESLKAAVRTQGRTRFLTFLMASIALLLAVLLIRLFVSG